MDQKHFRNISEFFAVGINYKNSAASVRSQYAIGSEQYSNILQKASSQGLNEVFILSTCNRTEIYGFARHAHQLFELLCAEIAGNIEAFKTLAYIKSGVEAIDHLFQVGAGLDSQILGDYEIVGQLKTAVKFAREKGFVSAFTERLVNCVLQSSKLIKNNTELSGGTVSVSFAAVQYIKKRIADPSSKKILLLGIGKIGRNTCKNLVNYLGTTNITLINRSVEKAAELATSLGVRSALLGDLEEEIQKADIIMVATNSIQPIILKQHLEGHGEKLIIDLSIPNNVESGAQALSNVNLVNVDELSRIKDETLKIRLAEVPKAKAIVAESVTEFIEWYKMRRHAPMLNDLKVKLKQLYPRYTSVSSINPKALDTKIQQVLNKTAGRLKFQNRCGCQYIAALNEFIGVKN